MDEYLLAFDMGSTSCKSCLYSLDKALNLVTSSVESYPFHSQPNGGLEQDPQHWWSAMVHTTRAILNQHPQARNQIKGLSFCAQMQGLVLVNKELQPLRPAMSYMDQRASSQMAASMEKGLKVEGINLFKLLKGLKINGAVAASVKDPVWKYHWVRENEPKVFEKIHKWLDVKDYLIARATGECTMTGDSAFATFMTKQKADQTLWSPDLCKMYQVDQDHLPPIIQASDTAGPLTQKAASELGLQAGIPVFGGGGDASMIALGAGAMEENSSYIYTGTSGWVSTTVKRRKVDINARIATIIGARPGYYHFFAEQETAGKCLEWVKDHLAKDEIDLYLNKKTILDHQDSRYASLYDFLIQNIQEIPPGSGGVIFTPWLHGNRSPFEDLNARGMFFNISLETGKRQLIRAVVEGIIFHQKWLLESIKKSFAVSDPIGFTGGSAQSAGLTQILANIIQHPVVPVLNPQNSGAAGAALTTAIGLGLLSGFEEASALIPKGRLFEPDSKAGEPYTHQFEVFKELYYSNKLNFKKLNRFK